MSLKTTNNRRQCQKPEHHTWSKWVDCVVPWLYVPRGKAPVWGRKLGTTRQCTRCDKKEVQVVDDFIAA